MCVCVCTRVFHLIACYIFPCHQSSLLKYGFSDCTKVQPAAFWTWTIEGGESSCQGWVRKRRKGQIPDVSCLLLEVMRKSGCYQTHSSGSRGLLILSWADPRIYYWGCVCVYARARTPACSTHFPYACMNVWLREELRMFLSWQWVYFKLGFLKILLKYRNVNTAGWCCPSCVLSHTHAQAFGIVGLLEVDRPLGLRTFWLHASLLLVHAPLAYMYICLYVRCMCYVHVYFRYKQSLIS